jgi:hypothetical protein
VSQNGPVSKDNLFVTIQYILVRNTCRESLQYAHLSYYRETGLAALLCLPFFGINDIVIVKKELFQVRRMEIFTTLEDARNAGMHLGRYGQYPTIYKRSIKDYIVVEKGEWPPVDSWPFLKWDGRDWVPVLARLDSFEQAQEATSLFALLGHNPIIVEFPGITFDLFFREAHIPSGAWIVTEVDSNFFVKYMKPPEDTIDDEESDAIEISLL